MALKLEEIKKIEYWEARLVETEKRKLVEELKGIKEIKDNEKEIQNILIVLITGIIGNKTGDIGYFLQSPSFDEIKNIPIEQRVNIKTRMDLIKKIININMDLLFGKVNRIITNRLKNIFQESFYYNYYNVQKGINVLLKPVILSNNRINKAIMKKWFGSKTLTERLLANSKLYQKVLGKIFVNGIKKGKAINQIVNEVKNTFGTIDFRNRATMRTDSTFVSNEAIWQSYYEIGIEKYQYSAILDDRTSEICKSLDGDIFLMDNAQIGINYPPMHVNCRSSVIPYFDNKFASLFNANEEFPKNFTYKQWYNRYISR